jgi:hypothetical protein
LHRDQLFVKLDRRADRRDHDAVDFAHTFLRALLVGGIPT